MRNIRFPIAGLMVTVLLAALGLAALRNATEFSAGVTFLATCAVLCLAIVGVVCRGGNERVWWLGFTLFGWGYLLLSRWSSIDLPTMTALDAAAAWLRVPIRFQGGMGGMGGMQNIGLRAFGGFGGGAVVMADEPLRQIAHCLWALVAAFLGGTFSWVLFSRRKPDENKVSTQTGFIEPNDARWWRMPLILAASGICIVIAFALLGSTSSVGPWAGAAFLLTSGLLSMTVLGTVSTAGKRRQMWLGAALFGIGYLLLAFGTWNEVFPALPTEHLLAGLRDYFPAVNIGRAGAGTDVMSANARIWKALNQPVPMPFLDDTPLEDVLNHIKKQTRMPDGKPIPMYLDPIGLQMAEKNPTSTIRNVDLEGLPLKTSLRLCLDQLDLAYFVRDGLLFMTAKESAVTPAYQDPFLIEGHCALALIAASFGGWIAPLFFRVKRSARAAP
jgi:hypothetical protein